MSGNGPQILGQRMRKLDGVNAFFVPFIPDTGEKNTPLFEVVLPKGSPNGPDPTRYGSDNLYHTGDLFESVGGEWYVYRGRSNDWIKTSQGLVDTKCVFMSHVSCIY
jgi:hypothetical protein